MGITTIKENLHSSDTDPARNTNIVSILVYVPLLWSAALFSIKISSAYLTMCASVVREMYTKARPEYSIEGVQAKRGRP